MGLLPKIANADAERSRSEPASAAAQAARRAATGLRHKARLAIAPASQMMTPLRNSPEIIGERPQIPLPRASERRRRGFLECTGAGYREPAPAPDFVWNRRLGCRLCGSRQSDCSAELPNAARDSLVRCRASPEWSERRARGRARPQGLRCGWDGRARERYWPCKCAAPLACYGAYSIFRIYAISIDQRMPPLQARPIDRKKLPRRLPSCRVRETEHIRSALWRIGPISRPMFTNPVHMDVKPPTERSDFRCLGNHMGA